MKVVDGAKKVATAPAAQSGGRIAWTGAAMADGGDIIRLDGVEKHFGAVHALSRVSISPAARASALGLVGHNGAGKSTLMQSLPGRLRPIAARSRWQGAT